MIHSYPTYGVVIEHIHGWKLVYSADSRPCRDLICAGRGANILIHEATFEEENKKKAIEDRHSTVKEAIKVGKDMNAGLIVLTHFSTRLENRVPELWSLNLEADVISKVLIAFDFMTLPIELATSKNAQSLTHTTRSLHCILNN